MANVAFLFPGQGAQHVGMGQDLYEAFAPARAVFDRAEAVSGLPLKQVCFEGPEDRLARTDICQPAIFTVSAAALAVLAELLGPERTEALRPAYVAGLSLGEYSALYAADAVDLDAAVALVTRRGQAMQAAATAAPSAMVSIIGLAPDAAEELCAAAADGQVLQCANFNCPGQIVLSGEVEACRRAEALADQFGAKMAVPLKVAGAFHSPLMQPAVEELAQVLADTELRPATVPVIANVDAQPYSRPEDIPARLLAQLDSPVRWQQCVEYLLAEDVDQFYEIGPGRVLAGLMRRIRRRANIVSLNTREALETWADSVS